MLVQPHSRAAAGAMNRGSSMMPPPAVQPAAQAPASLPNNLASVLMGGALAPQPPAVGPQAFFQQPTQQLPSPVGSLFDLDLGGSHSTRTLDRTFSEQGLASLLAGSPVDQLLSLVLPQTELEVAIAEHLRQLQSKNSRNDTGDLAADLLAMGLLVQVRRGAGSEAQRSGRSALRTLRHTFIVCTGYQRGSEPILFKEPLILEPRFKEQFVIAQPTSGYAQLLQMLPVAFVGTIGRLETAVRLLADQVALVFQQTGRSLPPWRSAEALLSRWCPAQLHELAKLMRESHVQHGSHHQRTSSKESPGSAQRLFCPWSPVSAVTDTTADPQEHAVAMEVVRSMSRQMSSTGMCAHSVPETQTALAQADTLRRSICGVQGGVPRMTPSASRASLTAGGTAQDAAKSGGAVGAPPSPQVTFSSHHHQHQHRGGGGGGSSASTGANSLAGSHHRSDMPAAAAAAAAASTAGRRVGSSARLSGHGGEGASAAPPLTKRHSGGMSSNNKQQKSPFSNGATAQVLEEFAAVQPPQLPATPIAGRAVVANGHAAVGAAQPQPQQNGVHHATVRPSREAHAHAHVHGPLADIVNGVQHMAGGGAAAPALPFAFLGATHPAAAPPPAPREPGLRIVRQSSTEFKQSVKQARNPARSALAAALKAAPPVPEHEPSVVTSANGGNVVGVRLGTRQAVRTEEAWPPKITTVKWGKQAQAP